VVLNLSRGVEYCSPLYEFKKRRIIMDKQTVEKVLDEQIRPRLMMDGGNIDLIDIKDNKVYVKLQGACGCCPGAQMTLKMGVERILKQEFPELEEVVPVK